MFFQINSNKTKYVAYLYDLVVAVQIFITFYCFLSFAPSELSILKSFELSIGYLTSLSLFWWSIKSSKELSFATGAGVGNIITQGPFLIVRHPFYLSYIITWITSTLVFNLASLWITLTMLFTFYVVAAFSEEQQLERTTLGPSYKKYKNEIGMFLPKATQWKNWFFGLFPIKTK